MTKNKEWIVTLEDGDEQKSKAICNELESLGFHVERALGQFILGSSDAALYHSLLKVNGVEAVEDSGEARTAGDT